MTVRPASGRAATTALVRAAQCLARWDTVTYFAGSLFFTSASFLPYREAVVAAWQV